MSMFRRKLLMANQEKYAFYKIHSNISNGNIYFDNVDTGFVTDEEGNVTVEILKSEAKNSYECMIKNGEYIGRLPPDEYYFSVTPTSVSFREDGRASVTINSFKTYYYTKRAYKTVFKNQLNTIIVGTDRADKDVGYFVDYISGPFDAYGTTILPTRPGSYSGYVLYRQYESDKIISVGITQF